jgi:hypothetical protein
MKKLKKELISSLNNDFTLKVVDFLQDDVNKISFLRNSLNLDKLESYKFCNTHRGLTLSFQKRLNDLPMTIHIGVKRIGKPKQYEPNNFHYELRIYHRHLHFEDERLIETCKRIKRSKHSPYHYYTVKKHPYLGATLESSIERFLTELIK